MNTTAGFPGGSAGKESTYNVGELGSIPGLGRSLVERTSCPLQYSGLENSMDCIIHGITKSWTRLSDFHFSQATNSDWQNIEFVHKLETVSPKVVNCCLENPMDGGAW